MIRQTMHFPVPVQREEVGFNKGSLQAKPAVADTITTNDVSTDRVKKKKKKDG